MQEIVKREEKNMDGGTMKESSSEYSEDEGEMGWTGDDYKAGSIEMPVFKCGKCISQPKKYMVSTQNRPIYMCPAERKTTEQLTDAIELWQPEKGGLCFVDPDGTMCMGRIKNEHGEEVVCSAVKGKANVILPRKVTLFTLNHDVMSIVVQDWVCDRCGFENRYSGECHGIYPAAKHRAFTVELMYFWMQESMLRGVSFRSIFELTSNLQHTTSYRRRIETGRLDFLAPEFKRDRRLGYEAIRFFCENIDLNDLSKCTQAIFSCSKCEVDLSTSDCKQLGITGSGMKGRKRFKALVMDGKVIGALRDYPVSSDSVEMLKGTKGTLSKLVNNRQARTALKQFTKGIRRVVRNVEYGRGADVQRSLSFKGGKVYFKLGQLTELKGVTKTNQEAIMKLSRWFCDKSSCLCSGKEWCETLSHTSCYKQRVDQERMDGCGIAGKVLSSLFGVNVGDSGDGGEPVRTTIMIQPDSVRIASDVDADDGSEKSDSTDSDDGEHGGGEQNSPPKMKEQWIYFKIEDSFLSTAIFDSLMETIQFVLGEPITLGFLPFFTHGRHAENDSAMVSEGRGNEHSADSDDVVWDQWSEIYMEVLNSETANGRNLMETDKGLMKKAIDLLTEETEKLHTSVSRVLRDFSRCGHLGPGTRQMYPCTLCTSSLDHMGNSLEEQNSIVTFFIRAVLRTGKNAPVLSRKSCSIVHDLLEAKLDGLQRYKSEYADKMDCTVASYWRNFGNVAEKEDLWATTDGEDSTFVFPGRTLIRPPIKSDVKDKQDCTKKYYTSRPNMTSFISLQCPCAHPKIIGFTLIREVESIAMAISTVLGFLNFPPRTLWYDNACNLYDSALIRTPFLLRMCYLLVDRFHLQGHTCSNQYNADRYPSLFKQRSVAAEVINSVLDKSAGFIRYLKGRNIKPYLRILFALHNFSCMVKDKLNRSELPLVNMGMLYNAQFKYSCFLCRVLHDEETWELATIQSMTYKPIHRQ